MEAKTTTTVGNGGQKTTEVGNGGQNNNNSW